MSDHDHGHKEHETEHKHDGCCGHDKDDGHSHEHGHEHSHGAPAAEPATSDRWMSAQQYKGLGKWLKPWGKPPTGTTFWIQIITTAAVIVISILRGVDTATSLVISNGPAQVQQAQENPMFLAGGIVTALFAAVLGGGYLLHKYQAAQAAAAPKEVVSKGGAEPKKGKEPKGQEDKEAKAAKAKEEAKEAKEERKAAKAARSAEEKAEALEKLEEELGIARQEILAQGDAQNMPTKEVRARLWALEQEHTDRIKLTDTLEGLEAEAAKLGFSQQEMQQRQQQVVQCHKEQQQMRQQCAAQTGAVKDEAIKEGALPAEVRRRVFALNTFFSEQRATRQKLLDTMLRVTAECKSKGLGAEQTQAIVQHESNKINEEGMGRQKSFQASERKNRAVAAAMQKEAAKYPPEVKALLLSRVLIEGLKARPELNGRCGLAATYAADRGRIAVTVGEESVLLKPEALTAVGFDDEPIVYDATTAEEDEPPPLEG